MATNRDYARATNKFDKFGIFADWGRTVTKRWNLTIRSVVASVGCRKIGVIGFIRTTGVTDNFNVFVAGRLIGYTSITLKTGPDRNISIDRLSGKIGTPMTTRTIGLRRKMKK